MNKINNGFIFLLFLLSPTISAKETTLSFSISTSNTKGSCAAIILTKAYEEIGYKLNFNVIPAQRALTEANNGRLDGVMNRIKGLEKKHPNLVRIATPICTNTYSLYMLKNNKLSSTGELVDLALGIKKGNTPLEKVFGKLKPYKTTSYQQLISMLITHRLDVIAMNEAAFANAIRSKKYPTSIEDIVPVDYPFPINYGYHYLHKKHLDLIPLIGKKLANLESSGYIKKANEAHRNYILYGN
mgnify:CR=1 FL=1